MGEIDAIQAELARTLRARLVASYQHLMGTASPLAIVCHQRAAEEAGKVRAHTIRDAIRRMGVAVS